MTRKRTSHFVWDQRKEIQNIYKHGISFTTAAKAFKDPRRVIFVDEKHSHKEERYFCLGLVENRVVTVRFAFRSGHIRIIGAGYWRKGKDIYEKENKKK